MAQTGEPGADEVPPPGYIEQLREHTKSEQHKLATWDELVMALSDARDILASPLTAYDQRTWDTVLARAQAALKATLDPVALGWPDLRTLRPWRASGQRPRTA